MEALRRRYLAHQVETASPPQRLLLLFGRLQRDLHTADTGFDHGDLKVVSDALVHAQQILLILRDSLGSTDWAGAAGLRAVYGFLHDRLVAANVTKDRSLLPDCVDIVCRIADANARALTALSNQAHSNQALSNQAQSTPSPAAAPVA